MKTYLPYFMRKIALAVFFVFFIITSLSGIDDFIAGLSGTAPSHRITNQEELIFSIKIQNELKWIGLVGSVLSLLTYILSKEKVEDEFLSSLRNNSMVKAVACSWVFYFLIKPLNWTDQFEGLVILQMQILAYVIIYAYTKKVKYAE